MVKLFPTFVLLILLSSVGCSGGISDKNISFVGASDTAVLMLDGVSELFGTKTRTVLIDCRESWRYNKASIPNAINIPFGQMRNKLYELDDAGIIIVSGETYNDPVAIAMSKTLMELGFKDVKTLLGGIKGWEDAEEPLIIK